jgi:hypothetical protein
VQQQGERYDQVGAALGTSQLSKAQAFEASAGAHQGVEQVG